MPKKCKFRMKRNRQQTKSRFDQLTAFVKNTGKKWKKTLHVRTNIRFVELLFSMYFSISVLPYIDFKNTKRTIE